MTSHFSRYPLYLISLLAVLLTACASGPGMVRTEVTSFNEWPASIERTYVFASPVGMADSLEQRAYENVVAEELAAQGFSRVQDAAAARLAVTVRARLSEQQRQVVEPIFFDPFWRGRWDTMWYPPGLYGGYGGYREYPVTVFQRALTLEIADRRATGPAGTGRRIYEGTVLSTGSSNSLAAVVPYLVRALFSDFPGRSGQTRVVEVPIDAR